MPHPASALPAAHRDAPRRTADLGRTGAARPRHRRGAVVAALLGCLVLVTGCVAPKQQTTPVAVDLPVDADLQELEDYHQQEVAWQACDDFECATVRAPLDWDDPGAGSIALALRRTTATGSAEERIGSLLINPGGPGVSGVEYVAQAAQTYGERLLAAYDLVGFDPRGVGRSSAVACGDDAMLDAVVTRDPPRSQADLDEARAANRALGEQCLEVTGPLLGEIDTVSAARDLDLLRSVLGDDELHYAGFSYGTTLGATYAGLYPENVGRLLLDGALPPSLGVRERDAQQAEGFQDALEAYVEHCQAQDTCPLAGDVEDGVQQVADLLTRLEARPVEAEGGHPVNGMLAFYGIALTLYEDAFWPYLTLALTEVMRESRATLLLELANTYLYRTPEGEYTSNVMIAFRAISCLDHPATTRDYEEQELAAKELAEVSPTFGRYFVMGAGCESWPLQGAAAPETVTAEGAAPILVVGTTGDPATPYEWSVLLADQLESAQLLTYEGEGHTAYGRANGCVADAVEDYLVDGVLPEEDLVC